MGTHYQGCDGDKLVLDSWIRFNRAMDSIDPHLRAGLETHGLTIGQFAVLEMLYHLGPQNQRCIGAKTLRSPGNVVTVVDNLERNGWVLRKKHPDDRRAYLVQLTDEGREKIAAIFQDHLQRLKEIFGVLTPEEIVSLGEMSKKLGMSIPMTATEQ